ncbi:Sterol desaturase/sphingolipid hydroxylase, fatty acid hydroxylase superfamily [Filimonas lacunae]|uniref:Sterol desaturase/sphingolipid hydroxylase, fatty acid hydroxylase superfamily n=1 Tax=Filimonas lacunae TaxID=477680 RepID=A0A173MQV2_9BACT|nr:sterol desaturase family protein [Filimonas lacunae]BAV09761.1 sterol desaturase-like protein [Filimonas lacunae]SIS78605.1 Sterol desaturase/sphingolipid hydroxylase, fatty acid hydroxylase superfamily [Filimonas lacunae]
METIAQYFSHIPSAHRALILAGGITLFWLIESAIPLVSFTYNKWRHAGINFFFTFTTIIINFGFALLIVLSSDWCVNHHFGLVQWLNSPLWLTLLIGLPVLDLVGAYLVHFIEHKIKWMWKFHMVHHSDIYVDTTTANRHHPGESVFRAVFTIIAVFVSGAPIWLVMLYQSLSVVLSQFNHANIKLPRWADRLIKLVIVTPGMHRVHHHYVRPETDSNYGNIFSFWDRLFGTYSNADTNKLQYGLDVLTGREDGNLKEQLLLPFDKKVKTDY